MQAVAQQKLTIVDSETGQPIFPAHVRIIKNVNSSNTSNHNWLTTDENGQVIIPASDSTTIEIRQVGYKNRVLTIFPSGNSKIVIQKAQHSLGEVVITGDYFTKEFKESVFDIKTINQDKINQSGSSNLREALNSDLNIRTNNGHVNETAILMNGLSGNHVKLMIDGVPVEGRMNGNIDLSQINLDQIERIEIIDGPASVVYGSNALAGTINLITKKNLLKKWNLGAKAYYESVGQYNLNLSGGIKQNRNQYKISLGRNFFDGFNHADTSRFQTWKPREQYFGSFGYSTRIKHMKINYALDAFKEQMISKGAPRAPYYTTAFDTWYETKRLTNRLSANGRISKNNYLDVTGSYSYYSRIRNVYFKDLTNLNQYLTEGETDQDTTVFGSILARGVYSYKNDSIPVSFLGGLEYKQDDIETARINNRKKNIAEYACFISADIKLMKKIILKPGLRFIYNTRYNAPLIPSFNVMYEPTESLRFKASYSRGYRAPDLKELYLEFHYNSTINIWGNQNLLAENSSHINISSDFTKKIKRNIIRFTPKFYYTRINNLIGVVQVSDVDWRYANTDFLIVRGFSANAEYDQPYFQLTAGYNFNSTYNSMFDNLGVSNKYFDTHNANTSVTVKLEKIKLLFTVNYKYCGNVTSYYKASDNSVKESSIGAYDIFDASFTKHFLNKSISVTAGVKNIFDVKNVRMTGDVYGVSAPSEATSLNVLWGRSAFVSLNYNL